MSPGNARVITSPGFHTLLEGVHYAILKALKELGSSYAGFDEQPQFKLPDSLIDNCF